jgi:DNA repair protein RadD
MTELRPYQEQALEAIKDSVRNGVRRLVVQAPTGSGKTLVAAAIVQGAQRKGNRLVFVVPAISLVDQALEMFFAEGIRDIGVIQADHEMTDWSKPVQIASIQTIHSRKVYPEAQVVIFDEVHQLHKEHIRWCGWLDPVSGLPTTCPGWERVPFIGLSATPWTRGLGRYFQSLLVMSTTKELISKGYLSGFRVMAADHPDLSKVKDVAGDYHEGQLSTVMQEKGLVANIVETYRSKWNQGKTLLFAVDCAHAQALQARFHDAGISCAYQDAKTPSKERMAIKRGFHSGQYQIISNVGTLTTGIDYDVRCLILARPTKSEILYVQIVGRALRIAEGKKDALILDHTDTTSRLGFVTDIHHDHLDTSKGRQKRSPVLRTAPLPKPCPACSFLVPVGAKTCPGCGRERKIESRVYEQPGELVEFSGSFRPQKKTDPYTFPYTLQEKARFYAQLKGYALQKSYQHGWAYWKFVEKFGHKPDRGWEHVSPMQPGPEVARYIKYGFIRWIMKKRSEEAREKSKQQPSAL